jgi:hypothetical protein
MFHVSISRGLLPITLKLLFMVGMGDSTLLSAYAQFLTYFTGQWDCPPTGEAVP